jgi:hypothetical protein
MAVAVREHPGQPVCFPVPLLQRPYCRGDEAELRVWLPHQRIIGVQANCSGVQAGVPVLPTVTSSHDRVSAASAANHPRNRRICGRIAKWLRKRA